MRLIFVFAMALIAALVACTGLLLLRPSLWPEAAARIGLAPPPAPNPGERDSPFAISPPANPPKSSGAPIPRPEGERPQTSAAQAAMPMPMQYPFPTATAVAVGTSKSAVLAAFGPPTVAVTGADVGRLNERIMYLDRSTQKKTVITIVNGKVASTATYVGEEAMQN